MKNYVKQREPSFKKTNHISLHRLKIKFKSNEIEIYIKKSYFTQTIGKIY